MFQHFQLGGVSKHDLLSLFALFFHGKGIGFNHDMLDFQVFQHPGQVLAVNTVTHDDDMVVQKHRFLMLRQHPPAAGQFVRQPGNDPIRQWRGKFETDRSQAHRRNRSRQEYLVIFRSKQSEFDTGLGENERELANLSQGERRDDRDPHRHPQRQGRAGGYQRLYQHDRQHQRSCQ